MTGGLPCAQVPDEAAIRLLLDTSAETLAGHLDRIFAHNRRLRARGRPSRAWYVTEEAWLSGAAAAPAAEGRGFFEDEVRQARGPFSVPLWRSCMCTAIRTEHHPQ